MNKRKRDYFQIEIDFIKYNQQLRSSLKIDSPNLDLAFKTLEHMEKLNFQPLMFKKYPSLVDTIQKVTKYIGTFEKPNGNEGKIVHLQYQAINKKIENIRNMAVKVLCKIESLFIVSDGQTFQEVFNNATHEFMNRVRHKSNCDVYGLWPDIFSDDNE